MDYQFSIIVSFYNTQLYLEDCITSVINQSLNFKDNVQLILVDDGSSDNSLKIAQKYGNLYPDNILVLSKENGGSGSGRNLGLKHAKGKYVNFLDSDDKLSNNALEVVLDYFNSNDVNIIAIPIQYFGIKDSRHRLNNKFKKTKIINVYEEYEYPQLSIASCFIKRDIFGSLCFDERLTVAEDAVLINKLLINERKYAVLADTEYLYRKRSDNTSLLSKANKSKKFFTDKINYYYNELIDYSIEKNGYVPKFIQYVLIYDCKGFYQLPTSDILNKQEFIKFRNDLKEVLTYIDEELIVNHLFLNESFKSFLIYLKNDEFHIEADNDKVFLKSKDYIINALHENLLIFDIIEIIRNNINISVLFKSQCDYNYIKIEAIKVKHDGSKEVYPGKFFDYVNTYRFPVESIGVCWDFQYSADFTIPFSKNEVSKIYFKVIYDEDNIHAEFKNPIQFQNYDAGLSKVSNYLIKNDEMIIYSRDESFNIQPYSFFKMLKLEVISILKIIKDHNSSMLKGILFHLIFLFFYPLYKNKRIWLFQDRLDNCDDNANHLFQYAIRQNDDIDKYYVIRKDCSDFRKMKEIDGNIIPHASFKHKLLYLFAEKIISSHVNHSWLNPFFNPKHPYFNGFLTLEKCFLQHGVIKDDLSSWFRKSSQNLHLFLTSSVYEQKSILGDNYNYNEEVVQLLGLPRHDNLDKSAPKKEILFIPTWRNNLNNKDSFEKSSYYLRLKSFLNNEKLINFLKQKGYKIIFKPHYDLIQFMDLFDVDESVVEINITDSYQMIFKDASLMITDYSSVFFDFSLLKKPIIYYHESDDYHYKEGYFNYETMGFGEIVNNEKELVLKVIEYINKDCKMQDKYKRRVDEFFKYQDKNNSKRVYEWLVEN